MVFEVQDDLVVGQGENYHRYEFWLINLRQIFTLRKMCDVLFKTCTKGCLEVTFQTILTAKTDVGDGKWGLGYVWGNMRLTKLFLNLCKSPDIVK